MEKTHQLDQLEPTGFNKLKPTGPIGEKVKLTKQEVLGCDIALSQYSDLMEPRFFKWYCKAFYQLGREQFARIAAEARVDGKKGGKKLFSYKLKRAMIDKQDGAQRGASAPLY